MEDHNTGEGFGGVGGGRVEVGVVNAGHDQGGVVADVLAGAGILIRTIGGVLLALRSSFSLHVCLVGKPGGSADLP